MLFWVNVHGSFVLGIAMVGIYALGTIIEKVGTDEGRKWLRSREALWQAGWMGAGVLASLANPYFVNIYHYFIVATNDPVARATNIEWQPPTLEGGTGMLFFVNVFILILSFYVSRRRVRPTEALLMLAFGYLSLTSLRNVMWWGWVTAPILAANLAEWAVRRQTADDGRQMADDEDPQPAASSQQPRRQEIPAFNWLIAGVLVGGALLFTPLWRESSPFVPASAKAALSEDTPVELAAFLKDGLDSGAIAEPLFNYLEWGGYLGWALFEYGPPHKHQMFVDGRFEARQVKVWDDYLSVSRGRADWQQTLDHYDIRTLILNKEFHKYLLPFVAQSNIWKKVYEDKAGVVYVR
jgi:hypothetical protein